MQLKPELVRDLLLTVEEYFPFREREAVWPQYASQDELDYHLTLLLDAGLIVGTSGGTFGRAYRVAVSHLSYLGHEYLDNLRSESVFQEVQRQLSARNLASISLDVFLQLARKVTERMVGLD